MRACTTLFSRKFDSVEFAAVAKETTVWMTSDVCVCFLVGVRCVWRDVLMEASSCLVSDMKICFLIKASGWQIDCVNALPLTYGRKHDNTSVNSVFSLHVILPHVGFQPHLPFLCYLLCQYLSLINLSPNSAVFEWICCSLCFLFVLKVDVTLRLIMCMDQEMQLYYMIIMSSYCLLVLSSVLPWLPLYVWREQVNVI